MNYLTIGGIQTTDFGVWISGENTFQSPERDVSEISVPGRNGLLFIDNGRYGNVDITYPALIKDARMMEAFRSFLGSLRGYQRLEDTYHPEEYRKAVFKDGIVPQMTPLNIAGLFDLTLNCKPQRWLKSGEQKYTSPAILRNPTLFNAKPKIRLYGKGALTIGDYTLTVSNDYPKNYIDIDCDLMNAYWGTTNYNNYVSGSFPELVPGNNSISWAGSSFEIQPNWWTL